jgi:hypothetical protein
MKYETEITEQDYIAAMWTFLRPRPWIKVAGYCMCVMGAVALVIAAVQWYTTGDAVARVLFLVMLLSLGYMGIFFPLFLLRTWRRNFHQQKTLHGPLTYEFTDEAFHQTCSYGNRRIPWADFHKWKEGPKTFLLYHSAAMVDIVPKRIFADEGEIIRFRATLMENVGRVDR